MFFDPRIDGMKPEPFKRSVYTALVVPRPIGWISTINSAGVVNLAPFSFSNALTGDPPCVMYCPNGFKPGTRVPKDSVVNAEATGEFVFNLCSYELREQMCATSAHELAGVDEMAGAGLAPATSMNVTPPRVAAAPISLECIHLQTIQLPLSSTGEPNHVVLGQVVGIHVADDVINDGVIDIAKLQPVARLGYLDYSVVKPDAVFSMHRPD